jgi:hypothetical protein
MHRDSLIQKRLGELAAKGADIAAAKRTEPGHPRGKTIEYASIPDTRGWGTSVLSLLRQAFGDSSVHTQQFQSAFASFGGSLSSFQTMFAIFVAAKEDYEGGYIFSLRGLVKAEVLSDALEQAEELLKSGYKDPACVLIGVSLEIALKELTTRYSLVVAKLDRMNVELCKAGVYNVAKQKQVTAYFSDRGRPFQSDRGR